VAKTVKKTKTVRFDQETINKVLSLLIANGLNYNKTSREANIPRTTLQRWAAKAGLANGYSVPLETKKALARQKDVNNEVEDYVVEDLSLEERERLYQEDLLLAKEKLIKQLIASIPRFWHIESIARTMKILKELSDEDPNKPINGEVGTVNYIEIIQNQLKFMKHGPSK
jgi:hypothetical protein